MGNLSLLTTALTAKPPAFSGKMVLFRNMKSTRLMLGVLFLLVVGSRAFALDPIWTAKASMPTARHALAAGVVNGKIYAIGGFGGTMYLSTVEEYDPATDTWTTKTPMPTARAQLAAGVVNDKIYAIGGFSSTMSLSTVEEYDPATDTWTTKAPMPTARWWLYVGVVNGKLYAIGGDGSDVGGSYLSTVEEYDPAIDTWTPKAPMPTARRDGAVGVVNGKLYAIGGVSATGLLSTVEEYNPAADTWTTKASMPTARDMMAIGVVNCRLYTFGGWDELLPLKTVEEYDPATDTWTTKADMLAARDMLAGGVVNGKLYAIGGYDETIFSSLSSIEEGELLKPVVAVVATHSPAPPLPGMPLTYSLIVTNSGAAPVTNLTITDKLPAGITFSRQRSFPALSHTNSAGTLHVWEGALTLNPGESVTVTIEGVVDPCYSGSVDNTAWVGVRDECGVTVAEAASRVDSFSLTAPNPALCNEPDAGTVKIVGGVRGYLDPRSPATQGRHTTVLVKPTGAGEIRMRIYNQRGVLIREVTEPTSGGNMETLFWDGKDSSGVTVAPGIYPVLIEGPGIRVRDKIAVIR